MFSTIPLVSILLLALAFLLAVAACAYCFLPYIRAAKSGRVEVDGDENRPMVTVVVYCQSDEDVLMRMLEALESQDYPNRETVVVCDGGEVYASSISDYVAERFSNVYVTFVQPGSHNLSRRKLANTIGIKAAKGEVILTTVANVSIPSDRWLSDMMAPFCGEQGRHTKVVLGATMIDFNELRGPGKWYRQFDELLKDASWVGYAAGGHPYRGDAYNLAFRRKFFFDNKGYAKTNHLHNGDDDVQLGGICTAASTKVVADRDNILRTEWGSSANRVWRLRKSAYKFTERWLPNGPFIRAGVLSALQWLVPAAVAASILLGLPSLWPVIIGAVTLLAMWGVEIFLYRRLADRFGTVRLWWAVVPFLMWRPIGNFLFNARNQGTGKKYYTWQR